MARKRHGAHNKRAKSNVARRNRKNHGQKRVFKTSPEQFTNLKESIKSCLDYSEFLDYSEDDGLYVTVVNFEYWFSDV